MMRHKLIDRKVGLAVALGLAVGGVGSASHAQTARSESRVGEHFPQTRQRLLGQDEAARMSAAQARYAINEMYARHGLAFKDPALRKQFSHYGWYKPVPGRPQQEIEARFNHYEHVNLELLSHDRTGHKALARMDAPHQEAPPENVAAHSGERCPETRSRVLRRATVDTWTIAQARYAVNEMYARHGFLFTDMAIRKQFLQYDWYKPVPGRTQKQAEARFNHYERANLKILGAARSSTP